LLVCWYWAFSLTRGRVCRLHSPLDLASAVNLGSELFETSLFFASYDSQGHGAGIRPRLHTGILFENFPRTTYMASAPTTQRTQLYCWLVSTAQKTSHVAGIFAWILTATEMCLPLHCMATSEVRWGYSFYCCVHYPATSNKHLYFYCCMPVSRFLRFNSSHMGETCHNMLGCIQENVLQHTAICLKWMEAASDTYCNYEATMVWSYCSIFAQSKNCKASRDSCY
jgi:hypothetical protein